MRAIGPAFTPEETEALIAAARSFRRIRFRHQGRNPKIGLDCAGLILAALKAVGRPTHDIKGYGREPHRNGLREAIEANLGAPVKDMKAGDVVLMRFDGDPRHVGLLAYYPEGGLSLIHTHDTLKHVTEHRLDDKRAATIVAVWRP